MTKIKLIAVLEQIGFFREMGNRSQFVGESDPEPQPDIEMIIVEL
jgi:hypothetical protein